MARGKRKPIDERIDEQKVLIERLQIRLEKENDALNDLYRAKRDEEVKTLYEFIIESNLSVDEAKEMLKDKISVVSQ